jgi:hypothetical protein
VDRFTELLDAGDYPGVHEMAQAGAPVRILRDEGLLVIYQCAGRVAASIALQPIELAALLLADAN